MASIRTHLHRVGRYFQTGGYSTPYREPRTYDSGESWNPPNLSTDGAVLFARPYIEARVKDLIQSDGFLAGALEIHCNHVVGSGPILSSTPDAAALGITEEAADQLADAIEREFDSLTGSSLCHLDAGRKFNWAAFCRQAYVTFMIHGEIAAIPKFRRGQLWNTSVMLIDPARICSPTTKILPDNTTLRDGIQYDQNGEAIAYYVRRSNPTDPIGAMIRDQEEFDIVSPRGRTGRRRIIHLFDPIGPEQSRGISMFAAPIESIKRQHDLSDAQLKSAIFQTLVTAVLKSELGHEQAMSVVGANPTGKVDYAAAVLQHMQAHAAYYAQSNVKLNGLKVHHLLPNEDLELKTAGIKAEYAEFAKAMNREGARGTGLTLEAYTGDYGGLSYSGGQLSASETDRGHLGRFDRVMKRFCQEIYELFLEELFIRRPELLPAGVDFYSHRDALSKAMWMGPPPTVGDPVKRANATQIDRLNRVTTLQYEASIRGMDWRKMLRQQAREEKEMERLGLQNLLTETQRLQSETNLKIAEINADSADDSPSPEEA